jgi:hypothetical protein
MTEPTIRATMDFPTKSGGSTDETFDWDFVKTLLDKEFHRRAEYVTKIVMAFKERYGDEAFDLARETIYNIGYEKGQTRAKIAEDSGDPISLENLAGQVAHQVSRLYFGTVPQLEDNKLVVREYYCPLPLKWKQMGFNDDEIVELCLMFDQVDKGMAEGYNANWTADLTGCRTLAEKGYCQMVIRAKDLAEPAED